MEELELENVTYLSMKNLIYEMYKNTYTKKINAKEISIGNKRNIELTSDGININKKGLENSIEVQLKEIYDKETDLFSYNINKNGYYYVKCYDENDNQVKTFLKYIQKGKERELLEDLPDCTYFTLQLEKTISSINLTTDKSELNKLDVQELSIKNELVDLSNSVNIEFVEKDLPISDMKDKKLYVQKEKKFQTVEDFKSSSYVDNTDNVIHMKDGYSAKINNIDIDNIITKEEKNDIITIDNENYYIDIKKGKAYSIINDNNIEVKKENDKYIETLKNPNEYLDLIDPPFKNINGSTVKNGNITIIRKKSSTSENITESLVFEALEEFISNNSESINDEDKAYSVTILSSENDKYGSLIREELNYEINISTQKYDHEENYNSDSYNVMNKTYYFSFDKDLYNATVKKHTYSYTVTKSYDYTTKYLFFYDGKKILGEHKYLVNGENNYPNDIVVVLGKNSVYIGNIKLV